MRLILIVVGGFFSARRCGLRAGLDVGYRESSGLRDILVAGSRALLLRYLVTIDVGFHKSASVSREDEHEAGTGKTEFYKVHSVTPDLIFMPWDRVNARVNLRGKLRRVLRRATDQKCASRSTL
jgi:hypothetical protein